RVAHDDADPAPDAEVDVGGGRLPAGHAVKPAPQHLLARPGLEHLLDGSVEGPLDSQHSFAMLGHRCSSRYSPTTSKRRSHRAPPPPPRRPSTPWPAAEGRPAGGPAGGVGPSPPRFTTPAPSSGFG